MADAFHLRTSTLCSMARGKVNGCRVAAMAMAMAMLIDGDAFHRPALPEPRCIWRGQQVNGVQASRQATRHPCYCYGSMRKAEALDAGTSQPAFTSLAHAHTLVAEVLASSDMRRAGKASAAVRASQPTGELRACVQPEQRSPAVCHFLHPEPLAMRPEHDSALIKGPAAVR